MRERSVLKHCLRLMDVGKVEEIWLAAGIREHVAGPGAAGGEQTHIQALWGTVAGKVKGIFWNLYLILVSPVDLGWSKSKPKNCLLKGINLTRNKVSVCVRIWKHTFTFNTLLALSTPFKGWFAFLEVTLLINTFVHGLIVLSPQASMLQRNILYWFCGILVQCRYTC